MVKAKKSTKHCPIHSENPEAKWRSIKPGTVIEFNAKLFKEKGKPNPYKKYDGLKGIIVRPLGCHEDCAGLYDYVISWDWRDERYVNFRMAFCFDNPDKVGNIRVADINELLDPRFPEGFIRISKEQRV